MTDPTRRNAFGYPVPDESGYLPLQDRPLLIELYESEPLLPAWAWFAGCVALAVMAAWVLA